MAYFTTAATMQNRNKGQNDKTENKVFLFPFSVEKANEGEREKPCFSDWIFLSVSSHPPCSQYTIYTFSRFSDDEMTEKKKGNKNAMMC